MSPRQKKAARKKRSCGAAERELGHGHAVPAEADR